MQTHLQSILTEQERKAQIRDAVINLYDAVRPWETAAGEFFDRNARFGSIEQLKGKLQELTGEFNPYMPVPGYPGATIIDMTALTNDGKVAAELLKSEEKPRPAETSDFVLSVAQCDSHNVAGALLAKFPELRGEILKTAAGLKADSAALVPGCAALTEGKAVDVALRTSRPGFDSEDPEAKAALAGATNPIAAEKIHDYFDLRRNMALALGAVSRMRDVQPTVVAHAAGVAKTFNLGGTESPNHTNSSSITELPIEIGVKIINDLGSDGISLANTLHVMQTSRTTFGLNMAAHIMSDPEKMGDIQNARARAAEADALVGRLVTERGMPPGLRDNHLLTALPQLAAYMKKADVQRLVEFAIQDGREGYIKPAALCSMASVRHADEMENVKEKIIHHPEIAKEFWTQICSGITEKKGDEFQSEARKLIKDTQHLFLPLSLFSGEQRAILIALLEDKENTSHLKNIGLEIM